MGNFTQSFSKELGKNAGKFTSNLIFGNKWATPHKHIIQDDRRQRRAESNLAQEYKEKMLEINRLEKEFAKQEKLQQKQDEMQQRELLLQENAKEVYDHNNYLEVIQTVHKDFSKEMVWHKVLNSPEPEVVKTSHDLKEHYKGLADKEIDEKIASVKANSKLTLAYNIIGKHYVPRNEWVFKIPNMKFTVPAITIIVLITLTKSHVAGGILAVLLYGTYYLLKLGSMDFYGAINVKNKIDDLENNRENWYRNYLQEQDAAHGQYLNDKKDYVEMIDIANGVLNKNKQSYTYAINFFNPFDDLKDYGSDITYTAISNDRIEVSFYVHGDDVIPQTTKRLLRNGLEVKEDPIPTYRFNEIYQDYVCSCILRIGRELFALLPIHEVLINATGNVLNRATGKHEEKVIASVLIDNPTLNTLNFSLLDPSDSMTNFKCNMNFKKTEGFLPVSSVV